jgi:integrase
MRAVLGVAFSDAERYGYVPRNVVRLVRGPKVVKADVAFLGTEQARALIEIIKGDRLEALYAVLLLLGLRRGEALALTWDDVDFDTGQVRVWRSLQRVDGHLQFVPPKSASSHRLVQAPASLLLALKAHKVRQLEEQIALGPDWPDTRLIFTSTTGTPLEPRNVNRRWEEMRTKAGLPKVRLHDLRHTYGSLMLGQGVQPHVVKELMGHSQISVTLNTYAHVLSESRTAAAAAMETAITRPLVAGVSV